MRGESKDNPTNLFVHGGLNTYRDAEQDYYYGASLLSPTYDCADRQAFFEGSVLTLDRVIDEFLQVGAPYKRSVWFENSAHMIPSEESGKSLVSLLKYVQWQ